MATAKIKRIGMLTGGGDCPGLNAVIRAVAKTAMLQYGIEVVGIEDGFLGLVENRVRPLSFRDVSGILTRGGTILGSNNRCNPRRFATGKNADGSPIFSDVTAVCIETIRTHALDALIVIGGDGTMAAATAFVHAGINIIGIPKTIDNDLVGTEISFGFLTAVATATEALDRLHSTADSHHRVMVCEVMGRNAGWIALTAGVASGSDMILIPEIPFDEEEIAGYINRRMEGGPGFAIVVVAEGATPLGGQQVIARIDPTSPDPIRLGGIGQHVADSIAANHTDGVKLVALGGGEAALGHVAKNWRAILIVANVVLAWIATIVAAQNSSTAHQNSSDIARCQRANAVVDQALKAIFNAYDLDSVLQNCGFGYGTDHCI